jgi:hypothetical protein
MTEGTGAIEVVAADFAGFRRVLNIVAEKELESFHSLSGQYALYDDVDPLRRRLLQLAGEIDTELQALNRGVEDHKVWTASQNVDRLDSLLEQLGRYVTVADLRGAALTSGDLLQKLQGWIKTLRDWLAGVKKQLVTIAGQD